MKPLKMGNTEACCFYACVFVGYTLDTFDRQETRKLWEIPDTLIQITGNKRVIWGYFDTNDRSILRAVVALGLFESGGEVRRNRPDLLQAFGPADRGLYTTTVGRTLVEFVVGWPTYDDAKAAEYILTSNQEYGITES